MAGSRASQVAAVLAVALVLGAGCSDEDPADYDAAFQREFLAECTDAYGTSAAPQVCGCWYDAVSRSVAFEELPSMDDLVEDDFDDAPTRIPGGERDLPLQLLAACVRSLGASSTLGDPVPLPTTPRPPAPPTTTTTIVA